MQYLTERGPKGFTCTTVNACTARSVVSLTHTVVAVFLVVSGLASMQSASQGRICRDKRHVRDGPAIVSFSCAPLNLARADHYFSGHRSSERHWPKQQGQAPRFFFCHQYRCAVARLARPFSLQCAFHV